MTETIEFKFHGRDEALDIINTDGDIVSYLTNQRAECPLIGSKIQFVKKLGEGESGIAFLINIEGMGDKVYVAKKISQYANLEEHIDIGSKPRKLSEIAIAISQSDNVPVDTLIALNGGDPNKIYLPGQNYDFFIPGYAKICKTDKDKYIDRSDGKGNTLIPSGSYMCDISDYSEYIIGVLCGNIYRQGLSVNFIDVFGFSSCIGNEKEIADMFDFKHIVKQVDQYVFMQKITGFLDGFEKCIYAKKTKQKFYEPKIIEVITVQLLHAISTYQRIHQIQHNDLHTGNIFIEVINSDTEYKGKKLNEADWFHYKIDNVDIYLPYIPLIVKIGDFGLSVKYSHRIIGNKESMTRGYDQNDKAGPVIPNWYCPNYDSIVSVSYLYRENDSNVFLRNILGWMLGYPENRNLNKIATWLKKEIKAKFKPMFGFRPTVKYLATDFSRGTPDGVLKNKNLMEKYLEVPSSGKIITLGSI